MIALILSCIFAFLSFAGKAQARPLTETDVLAASLTAGELGLYIDNLEKKPNNVAVFDVRVNAPLDPNFAEVIEGEIVRVLRDTKSITVMNCFQCRVPRVEVRDDKLVVKKGMPDQESLAKFGKELSVDSFLMIDVYRTRFSLITQVTLLQAMDGTIIGTTQIKVPALEWSEAGMLIMADAGPALAGGGNPTTSSSTPNYNYSIDLAILEEVGFGKAGLVFGGVGGPSGGLAYVTPTVAWRGRFGAFGISSLTSLGLGFGLSDNVGGIAARAAYTVLLGSFTVIGAEAVGMMPIGTNQGNTPLTSAFSLFIGFSLGR